MVLAGPCSERNSAMHSEGLTSKIGRGLPPPHTGSSPQNKANSAARTLLAFKWPPFETRVARHFIPPHHRSMTQNSSALLPREIPSSFFEKLDDVTPPRTTITSDLHQPQRGPNTHSPTKAMLWYDAIIDDMFANPGTTQKATAARLGRSAVTIGYIVNSDLFKARYAQRRDQFNEELDSRLVGKLAKVAELSLDLTLESLEKKRTAVPLPLLHEVSDKALARLGYGPKQNPAASVAVTVNNANGSVAQVQTPVSAEALAEARLVLHQIETSRAATARLVGSSSAREAAAEGGGSEDGSEGSLGAL